MYILSITQDIVDAARTLALFFCEIIYSLICFCFDVFNGFGKVRLDIDVSAIFQRVELVLGLFMIFRLTFAAIEYLINPDSMMDKEKGIGNIIKKVLIVIILLGSTGFLFNEAYKLQDELIDSQLIEKIILPDFTFNEGQDIGSNGDQIAWYTFSQFYSQVGETNECGNGHMSILKDEFYNNHNFNVAYKCLNEKNSKKYIIDFNGVVALLCGGILLWIIVVYTVQLGVRVIQLAYLEIIAPIPIMMYLMPKGEDKVKKWAKQCLSTFLDFFIRVAILDFVILVSSSLISPKSNLAANFEATSKWGVGYITVIMIIALFTFAKKVPNLLKEIFPSTGSAGFDFGLHGKSAKQLGTFAGGAVAGGIGGMATGIKYGRGTVGGRLGGAITGFARGTLGGAKFKGNVSANAGKGMANQRAAMQRAYNKKNDGSDFFGRTLGAGDAARTKAAFDEELAFYEGYQTNADIIDKELEKNEYVQHAIGYRDKLIKEGADAAKIGEANKTIKAVKKEALIAEINKDSKDANATIMTALANEETYRTKGKDSGYAGFGEVSITNTNLSAQERAKAFFDNKDTTKNETRQIKEVSGSRNEAYKKAEANAKYAKDK